MAYSHKLIEHPLVRQLRAHGRDPVDGTVDDDDAVDAVGGLDGRSVLLNEARELLITVSFTQTAESLPWPRRLSR